MVECLPVILVLRRYRQEDHKFKVILVYIVSLRPAWATYIRACLKKFNSVLSCYYSKDKDKVGGTKLLFRVQNRGWRKAGEISLEPWPLM